MYGEIYYVDDAFMGRLDHFEGYPSLYQRDVLAICVTSRAQPRDGEATSSVDEDKQDILKCTAYLLKNFDQALLDKETFSSYDSSGPHGLHYRPE